MTHRMLTNMVLSGLIVLGLRCTAAAADGKSDDAQLYTEARAGFSFTDAQAKAAAVESHKDQDNAVLHARLLGYDLARKAETRDTRDKEILWMIANRPKNYFTSSVYCQIDPADDPDGYSQAKSAWDKQLGAHATDGGIFANAAAFRSDSDFAEAQSLLGQAIAMDPKNAAWLEQLAMLDENHMARHPAEVDKLAPDALTLRQQAYSLTPDPQFRFRVMLPMPDDALKAQDLIGAKRFAQQLLGTAGKFRSDPLYGDAIHRGNIVLGEAAMAAGLIDKAEEYLAAAAQTPGSPALTANGPDLNLARELLAHGERTAVHDYLQQCDTFWKAGHERIQAWLKTLDTGGTPDLK